MKIYIAHSRAFDYQAKLYAPIRNAANLPQADIILPHEFSEKSNNTRESYASLDLMIAEVSYPATGLGIELGWAYDSNVPIVCISQKGARVSGSLQAVTKQFYEYNDGDDLVRVVGEIISHYYNAQK